MDYDTLYGIYNLALILFIIAIMIPRFQDILDSRIERAKIRKKLESYEKEEDKAWANFKQSPTSIIYISCLSESSLENSITQVLYKYDIDRNTLDITYKNHKGYSIACITHKNKGSKECEAELAEKTSEEKK